MAKGWDLEVYDRPEPLLVEVMGLLNTVLTCELTPNEYDQMMQPVNRGRYVTFVVNNALAEHRVLSTVSISEHLG